MSYATVLGTRMRVTLTDKCGKPIEGARNRLVTEGFIRLNLDPVRKQADELEQNNAAGKVCVSSRTTPERKWWNVEGQFCDVDPELWTMLAAWQQVLDYADNPIGVIDQPEVDDKFGVSIEVWTDIESDDECAIPTDDDVFDEVYSGERYGYFQFCAKEFVLGAITIEAQIGTFTFTGITMDKHRWGRGPYNVYGTDATGTPGRLPAGIAAAKKSHLTMFETPVPPPDVTNGACQLNVQSVFTDQSLDYYGASAVAVAPLQPICDGTGYTVTVTGSPTGGTFTLSVAGDETADIDYDATAAEVLAALNALQTVTYGQVTVAGSAGGPYTVTLSPELGELTADGSGLTGGTSPNVTVVAA